MSDIQFKNRHTNRYDISMDGIYSLELKDGTYAMFSKAFKEWEVRRGFISEEEAGMTLRERLRGRPLRYAKLKENQEKKPKKVAPKKAAPKKVAPKKAAPKKAAPKKVAPKKVAPKKKVKKKIVKKKVFKAKK